MTPPMDDTQRMTDAEFEEAVSEIAMLSDHRLKALLKRLVTDYARTRSVEPPREMVERAETWLNKMGLAFRGHGLTSQIKSLATEFTAIRLQAIEEAASVAATKIDLRIDNTPSASPDTRPARITPKRG